uniref:Elicitor-responsive protein 3 n=1 Tax=Anthurium amnicola TaxID=1678845 RepID=A0A1D1Y709_9ARAE
MSIQGQALEVTVVGCNRLRDTEWISRQDPYVCLEYAGSKFRTRTHTDGDTNPTFQERFTFKLIEGCREISVAVWNSNTFTRNKLIGSGKILLHKALSTGSDDASWTIQTKYGTFAGEVNLIMKYYNDQQPQRVGPSYAHNAPPSPSPYSLPTLTPVVMASFPPVAHHTLGGTWSHHSCPHLHTAPPCPPIPAYPPPATYPSPYHPMAHAPQVYHHPGAHSGYPPPPRY